MAFYAQDSYTVKRFTLNLGLRYDMQDDEARAADVPANPMFPAILPAIAFPGADAGVTWKNVSPRLGMTYDVTGQGKTVMNASYATYFGQMAPGQLSSELAATGAVTVRYAWSDTNGDTFVQANEVNTSAILSRSSAYDPNNPTNYNSPGKVDPNIKNDRTDEFIVGLDHELRPGWGIGASYIWRNYSDFNWRDVVGLSSSNYQAVTYQATTCPASARCPAVVYYQPTIPLPSAFLTTNIPDRTRSYNGLEFTLRKRMSNRWAASASYAYNDAIDHWDSPNAYEDPTNINPQQNGAQYAPVSAGSGVDNVYTNAKWLVKVNGSYLTPLWDINIAGGYQGRQGFPFPQGILSPNRINSAGQVTVLLDPLGDVRLANFNQFDLRIDKSFNFGNFKVIPSMDAFNLTNGNTVLAQRRNMAAANANNVSQILSPRVIRFGIRASW
jgi:hypothetical protein